VSGIHQTRQGFHVTSEGGFLPALAHDRLTPLYDPVVRITTREYRFKRQLIAQAAMEDGQDVLDLGCGTGTLSILIRRANPGVNLTGCDADPAVLAKAEAKASSKGFTIGFDHAFSDALPYEEGKFDRVFSTLMFHHLEPAGKTATIKEILRVLKPGGEFHLADYGYPKGALQARLSKIVKMIDGERTTASNFRGELKGLISEGGFSKVDRTGYIKTVLGTIRLFRAVK
jgi:ubiquinone/menaquinone biosynthesis C-methylase UbiE